MHGMVTVGRVDAASGGLCRRFESVDGDAKAVLVDNEDCARPPFII